MSDLNSKLQKRYDQETQTIRSIWDSMVKESAQLKLDESLSQEIPDFAACRLQKDDFDSSESLYCEWRDEGGNIKGHIVLHANGSVFAEYDLLQYHPTEKHRFIEAVSVFGRSDQLASELRYIDAG